MDLIINLFGKLVEVFRSTRKTTLERLEKTRARILNKFYKKAKRQELREAKKNLTNKELQEHIINQANERLEQQTTDKQS